MRRLHAIVVILSWAVCALCGDCWGADRKLVIAVLDQVTWHDLLSEEVDAPTLRWLASEGAVGMMCVRTGRGGGGGYLTIGAGSRASVITSRERASLEGRAFMGSEAYEGMAARDVFRAYTGWPVGDNAVVHLGIGELLRHNYDAPHPLRLGLLGGTLRRSGIRVACVGNADTRGARHREVACIAMDEQGMVGAGDVSAGLVSETASLPYRFTTHGQRLAAAVRRASSVADVIVLELGETSRAAEYAHLMPPGAAQAARARAIREADHVLGLALDQLPRESLAVLVVTPNARRPEPEEGFAALTPVVFYVPGEPAGLLTSPSTRRLGLVLNTDIAPTVLSHFDVRVPREVVGRPLTRQPTEEDAVALLLPDVSRQDAVEAARRWLFRGFPMLAAAVLWVGAFLLAAGERAPRWARSAARGLLLLALAAPPAMLLVAVAPMPASQMVVTVGVISVIVALVGAAATRWRSGYALPAVALAGLLAYDLLRGQLLLQWSPLSYSAAAGARFYGLGNEYGGALLGAALIGASALLAGRAGGGRAGRGAATVCLLGIIALAGGPAWGANLGIALGCAVGFGVFGLHLWRARPTGRDLAIGVVLALVLAGAAIAIGVLVQGVEASHIGRWASRVRAEGWPALLEVATRKLSMNWLLLRVSLWTSVAAAALGVLAVAALARPPALRREFSARPFLRPALLGCLAGSVASFLLNDSGIVAAALALLYGAGALVYVGISGAAAGGEAPAPPSTEG